MKPSPRVARVLKHAAIWSLVGVVALLAAGAGWVVWAVRSGYPQHEGELTLGGLSAPVTVHRDSYGIAQLFATSEADLLMAQGYVHAQDRFWEMDFRRHVTAGRVAEIFGESQLKTDLYLRTMGWRRVAQLEWALLAEDTRAALQAYAAGVNAWIEQHPEGNSLEYKLLSLQNPDYVIEKWHPVDSLAWLKAMAWDLRGNMQAEIRRTALLGVGLTKEQVDELYPPYPFDRHLPIVSTLPATPVPPPAADQATFAGTASSLRALEEDLASLPGLMGNADGDGIGSNSWVISGEKTGTGKPILANDPHLSPSQPGIWYQMGLHCECGLNVAGFTFSGVPGVIIGHNARIAWGFTNLGPDVIDLYVERLDSAEITTRQETVKVAGGEDVTITIRGTKHGPLISDASDELKKLSGGDGQAIAIRWTALDPGRTADAILKLNKAANWQDFRAAAALFEVPAQNLIYADVDGNIGYQTPGKIPVRGKGDGRYFAPGWDPAYDWAGYIPFEELPTAYNPPQGYLVTANQAAAGPQNQQMITQDWAYGYRSQRINEMLSEHRGRITVDDVQEMQFDSRNGFAATLVPVLTEVQREPLSQVEQDAAALLKSWREFDQPEDSAAAAYYNAIWRHLLALTFDELTAEHAPDGGGRWFEVVRGLVEQPDSAWWDDKSTPAIEKRDDMLARAMAAAVKELADAQGEDASDWRWGAMHTLTPTHATFGSSGIAPIEWLFNLPVAQVSGGDAIVNATGWNARDGYEVDAVPSMRMIVDLSNLDESRWIQLTGNSGHPFHPNYSDQFELWRTGQLISFRFDRLSIEREKAKTLTLVG